VVCFTKKSIKRYDGRKYLRTVVEVLPTQETSTPVATKAAAPKKSKTEASVAKASPAKVEKKADAVSTS
jgi:Na+-translocating ferredoxin:NAD+ oxidoreductase RnfG subunit